MASKVWLITGTSKGFGRIWAEAALARGDRVAATARDVKTLGQLSNGMESASRLSLWMLPIKLRCAPRSASRINDSVVDVVINNAGYGLFGAIEEVSETEAREQLETNLFGALWVTRRCYRSCVPSDRSHYPGVIDRWGQRLSDRRPLSRLKMGPRRIHSVARR